MKLKKLSATFDDREHGEKARPLGPEVKKRDVTAARDDYSSYLLSNQQANAQQLDEEDPVTTTDPPPPPPPPATPEPPQLPESYRQAVDAFENAIALQGGNMDTDASGTLDVLDVAGIIDFFMTVVGQSVDPGGVIPQGGFAGLFWNPQGNQYSFENNSGLFFSPGPSFGDGSIYYTESEDGIAESLLTWADYMAADVDAEDDGNFFPIPLDWANANPNQYTSALQAVFDAYQGAVPDDFFDTLLMNPQPTEADLEDLGAWFDANMLPIMNIYADVYMSNVAGDPLGYSESNFQDMMNYIESQGTGLGFFNVSVNDTDYNPFSGNIFDVNNDGTFNGADIAAWADFTEMVSAVSGGGTISEANNLFSQADIDQIIEYYTYYGVEMAGGNIYFSTNGEWDNTQNLFDINNVAENPPLIFNLLDSGDVDAYVEEQEEAELQELIELTWYNQRPVWGQAFGLSEDLQSESPDWYIAFANSFSTWMSNGYDANYTQQSPNYNVWAGQGPNAQVEAYQSQIASWISANFFDADGDGQYNPSDLDGSVVDFLIENHPQVSQLSDITPEVFGEALNIMPQLLNECSSWVNSVGGIPEWANIIGQENTEPFNHLAQNAALLFLATSFGHQNSNADPTAQGPDGFDYSYQSLFEYLGYDSEQALSLASYVESEDGFVADQTAFGNWLYSGFLGFVGVTDPNTGLSSMQSVGEGVLYAPAGWEPGDNYNDYAYYQGQGPDLFDVLFYNFELDLSSQGFLFTYNAFLDSTAFYTPPLPPNVVVNPTEGVEILFGDSTAALSFGLYLDIENIIQRTGGFMDFSGDGQIGLADFFNLHEWIFSGAENTSLSQNGALFAQVGYGWTVFNSYATTSNWFSNTANQFAGAGNAWYGFNNPDYTLTLQSVPGNYDYAGVFSYSGIAGSNEFGNNGYNPEVSLAAFLVFQFVNDYVNADGNVPTWYETLTTVGFSDTVQMLDAIDPDWQSMTTTPWAFNNENMYFVSTVLPYLQSVLPDSAALSNYANFYIQQGLDINNTFVLTGGETISINSGPPLFGGDLNDIISSISEQNYWANYISQNPGVLAALDFNGDGAITQYEGNLIEGLRGAFNAYYLEYGDPSGGDDDFVAVSYDDIINLFQSGQYSSSAINQFVNGYHNGSYASAIVALFSAYQAAGLVTIMQNPNDLADLWYVASTGNAGANQSQFNNAWYSVFNVLSDPFSDNGLIDVALFGDGTFYIDENGVSVPISQTFAGQAASDWYSSADWDGTEYTGEGAAEYQQLLELLALYGDIDFNNDGLYTSADVEFLNNLIGGVGVDTPEAFALDLNADNVYDENDVLLFVQFFGNPGVADPSFGFAQYGYFSDSGEWVDFDFDDLTVDDYFGNDWSPSGYTETAGAPPLPTP